MKKYFITGIGTGVGKTIVSAVLCEALKADYWKPVQCGNLEESDSATVKSLLSNKISIIHKEAYKLKTPASPHYAASLEKIKIDPERIKLPVTDNHLIVEGAGGLMVPLNEEFQMIDLIKKLDAEVILVSQNYLGSINHTLLSIDALKSRKIRIKGIIFNGESNPSSVGQILRYSKIDLLFSVPKLKKINKEIVSDFAEKIKI